MSEPAVRVTGLGKLYRIGERLPYRMLRDDLTALVSAPARKVERLFRSRPPVRTEDSRDLWALRNVSFEVEAGEVVGIIGRNGAGKSTLLSILSRITPPTEGEAEIRGRVGSLLEVGAGFHPELTGRENIFLNGTILGMQRAEIARRFDEIVAFAEVERFVDTPVKRYSTGMYVRLAFAVAAHLEPEILIVDEVLSVGDAAFQRRCLRKMEGSAKVGRTVLFVSHNMGAVNSLCNRCLLLDGGSLVADGMTADVTALYQSRLHSGGQTAADSTDLRNAERDGNGKARFRSLKTTFPDAGGPFPDFLHSGDSLKVELEIEAIHDIDQANVAAIIYDSLGYRLIDVNSALRGSFLTLRGGERANVTFVLENVLLKPGSYLVSLWLGRGSIEDIDAVTYAGSFSVEPKAGELKHSESFPGPYQCAFSHRIETAVPLESVAGGGPDLFQPS